MHRVFIPDQMRKIRVLDMPCVVERSFLDCSDKHPQDFVWLERSRFPATMLSRPQSQRQRQATLVLMLPARSRTKSRSNRRPVKSIVVFPPMFKVY